MTSSYSLLRSSVISLLTAMTSSLVFMTSSILVINSSCSFNHDSSFAFSCCPFVLSCYWSSSLKAAISRCCRINVTLTCWSSAMSLEVIDISRYCRWAHRVFSFIWEIDSSNARSVSWRRAVIFWLTSTVWTRDVWVSSHFRRACSFLSVSIDSSTFNSSVWFFCYSSYLAFTDSLSRSFSRSVEEIVSRSACALASSNLAWIILSYSLLSFNRFSDFSVLSLSYSQVSTFIDSCCWSTSS